MRSSIIETQKYPTKGRVKAAETLLGKQIVRDVVTDGMLLKATKQFESGQGILCSTFVFRCGIRAKWCESELDVVSKSDRCKSCNAFVNELIAQVNTLRITTARLERQAEAELSKLGAGINCRTNHRGRAGRLYLNEWPNSTWRRLLLKPRRI